MRKFKPQLLPNEPAGEAPDWEARLTDIHTWMFSTKLDGARVELLSNEPALGRSLKVLKSKKIQEMAQQFCAELGNFGGIFEAEFYSPNMSFSEIMHFFKVEDLDDPKHLKKWNTLWAKTREGQDSTKVDMDNYIDTIVWPFPGRTPEWLCTWHEDLKFHIFDYVIPETDYTKLDRYLMYKAACEDISDAVAVPIKQSKLDHIDEFYQAYDQAMMDGHEGLCAFKANSHYKMGRHTLKSNVAYKAKENKLEFDGRIVEVLEGTFMREGAEKTVNELGRSVTSKLKEDRVPGGFAKGFLVVMEDGRELTVSLNGWNHPEKEDLLVCAHEWIGQWIRFTGMKPVKVNGVPRHAQATKGNCIRDAK